MGALSNLDSVTSTDRGTAGNQPDSTPSTGTGPSGGGGGPAGVSQIVAGTGVSVNPPGGTGAVTIAATGSLPGGGSQYNRLIKTASASGWFPGSVIDAADYLDQGSTLQTAFNAACTANGVLLLPPGPTALPNGGLVLPAGFTGGVGIRGCGRRASILYQANASVGISFVPNVGQPGNTTFVLEGFSVRASNAACTTGIAIDYGTGSTSEDNPFGGSLVDVDVYEATSCLWTVNDYYFRNCWSYDLRGISGAGTYSASGGGTILSGNGITIDSCCNMQFTSVNLLNFAIGVNQPSGSGALGASQGTKMTNVVILQCVNCFNFYLGTNQGVWITNFLLDDGNNAITNMLPVVLTGSGTGDGGSSFTCGQVLQFGGVDAFQLNNCTRVTINNVDFTYCDNSTAAVHCKGGTTNCSIQACGPPAAGSPKLVVCDSGTSGTKAFNNITGASFTDNGSNTLTS